jgi:MAGE family
VRHSAHLTLYLNSATQHACYYHCRHYCTDRLKTTPITATKKPWHRPDSYYLLNTLTQPAHAKDALHEGDASAARGLLMLTLGLIYCQPGKTIAEDVLLGLLHDLDDRIPLYADLGAGTGRGKAGGSKTPRDVVNGLGSVKEVLKNLVEQHYLTAAQKEDFNSDGDSITEYSMGTRSYLEVGRRVVIKFLCETLGQAVDPVAMGEVTDEESGVESDGDE